jgi:uncharacterized membrane protein
MKKAIILALLSFVGAALLALFLPSTWPLVLARIILICLGIAWVVMALKQRRRRGEAV